MRHSAIAVVVVTLLCCFAGVSRTHDVSAQTQKFSDSPEYRAILEELSVRSIRPTRLGSGDLARKPIPTAFVAATDTRQALTLEATDWRLQIDKAPWRLALTNKHTGVEWRTDAADTAMPGLAWFSDVDAGGGPALTAVQVIRHTGNQWTLTGSVGGQRTTRLEISIVAANVIRLTIEAPTVAERAINFNFSGSGPFFGLGERFGKSKLDGQRITLWTEDKLGTPGHDWTYVPAPMMFTPRGLGLYFDTAAESVFDLRQSDRGRFAVQVKEPSTDCYLLVGDPRDIVRDYTGLTGRTPLAPPWAFGVWVSGAQGFGPVVRGANRLRQQGIPASALWVFDLMDEESNLGWGSWTSGHYGEPGPFTERLHRLGFKVLGYVHPYVRSRLLPFNTPSRTFTEGVTRGYFVTKPNGEPAGVEFEPVPVGNVDFTNPEAVSWWETMLRRAVVDFGLDGWMEDFGEQIKSDNRFRVKKSGRELATLYPLLYHKISYAISTRLKPDLVAFSRSGYSGSQGYSRVVWGGDQVADWSADRGYPSAITAGISAGLSGCAVWTPDILSSGTSKELWSRWVEFGALTSVMRDHPWDKPKFAVDLWFDQDTTDLFRRYARLHTSLFPYLYTYAHRAAETGLPIMRHPLLEFPDDNRTFDAEYEYLLGEELLVAPVVTDGARTRSLYLPAGEWVDYWTGAILTGGRTVEIAAPLDRIPILVRAGSIVPMIDGGTDTLAADLPSGSYKKLDNALQWRVFASRDPSHRAFVNYDGTTASVDQSASAVQVKVERSPSARRQEVIVPLSTVPADVTLDSRHLDPLENAGDRANGRGWWMDRVDGTFHVTVFGSAFTLTVTKR